MVGILRDGSYTESMWRWGSEVSGGHDRPGNYEVEIRAEGYLTWTKSGIIVEPGVVCRIDDPGELMARLASAARVKPPLENLAPELPESLHRGRYG